MSALLAKLRDIEVRETMFHTRDDQSIGVGVEEGITLAEWKQIVHAVADYEPLRAQYLALIAKHDAVELRRLHSVQS